MIVNILSALVVMTAFVFGTLLLFSHADSSFEYKMLGMAQTAESRLLSLLDPHRLHYQTL
jgi:hypothetical protein